MRQLCSFVVCFLLTLFNSLRANPVAVNDTIYLIEDQSIAFNVLDNDYDSEGGNLFALLLNESQQAYASMNSDGVLQINPYSNFFGEFDITYQCCNSLSGTNCAIGYVHVEVEPVNDPPTACMQGGIKLCKGHDLNQDIFFNSAVDLQEGQVTTLTSFSASPGTFAFNGNGLVSIYPPEDYIGPITINYTVCDNGSPQLCASFVNTSLIVVDDQFVVSSSLNSPTCLGRNNGSIIVGVSGGIGYYQYNWSHGPFGATANNLGAGSYSVNIHDLGNCAADSTLFFELTATQLLEYALSEVELNCSNASASIEVQADGGIPEYQVIWEDGTIQSAQTVALDAQVPFTIKDVLGCRLDTFVFISSEPCQFENAFFPEGFSPNNDGFNDYFEIVDLLPSQQGSLVVWNLSGRTVYSSDMYKNDWSGVDDSTGELVPPSTYYYVFKVKNSSQQKEGVLTIQY